MVNYDTLSIFFHSLKTQCDTCKRAFANAEEYGLHMCKHYGCDMCQESFMTKRNLEIHKRYHAGEQIFSCDLCEALFVNR